MSIAEEYTRLPAGRGSNNSWLKLKLGRYSKAKKVLVIPTRRVAEKTGTFLFFLAAIMSDFSRRFLCFNEVATYLGARQYMNKRTEDDCRRHRPRLPNSNALPSAHKHS